jgi:hypothetical protein
MRGLMRGRLLSGRHNRVSSTAIVCPISPKVNRGCDAFAHNHVADEPCGQLVLKADEFPFRTGAGAIIPGDSTGGSTAARANVGVRVSSARREKRWWTL